MKLSGLKFVTDYSFDVACVNEGTEEERGVTEWQKQLQHALNGSMKWKSGEPGKAANENPSKC